MNIEDFLQFENEVRVLITNGYSSKAIQLIQDVLKRYPDYPGIYYLFGLVHKSNRHFQKSIDQLKQALYLDNNSQEYWILLSKCYIEVNDERSALEAINAAYKIDCNNKNVNIIYGKLELKRRNIEAANKYAETAYAANSKDLEAIKLLVKCHLARGNNYNEAVKLLREAKTIRCDDETECDLINSLYMSERISECLKECRKIITRNPNSQAAEKARELASKIKNEGIKQNQSAKYGKTPNQDKDLSRDVGSVEEALGKLNSLIGLDTVKTEIQRIIKLIEFDNYRNKELGISNDTKQSYHFMFVGNPGTGKTTVARLIGDIFYFLGILEKGHLIEVDRSTIVGQYIGQTAVLTKEAIEKAMGGVLFIDEAYSLARGGETNNFGAEAIDTLVKYMEDYRGRFVVILAGYTREMHDLIKLNPGLKSRINIEIAFPDYNDEELIKIGKSIAAKELYSLSLDGEKAFQEKINMEKINDYFANARVARNIIESAIRGKAYRLGGKMASKEELIILQSQDFGVDISSNPKEKISELLNELNNMVGLSQVKNIINKIASYVQFQRIKKEIGKQYQSISLNMVFLGNPGTGKTTTARVVSKLLKEIGVLKRGHLVEVSREELVGQYVGQTAPKTLEKIKEAYGGVLFIDEAYSLNTCTGDDFGKEAIATLIKEMEDNRDKLVVIMAGYTEEMKELLGSNSGLASRVGFTVEFSDYTPHEMSEIFKELCIKEEYVLTEEAEKKVYKYFKYIYDNKDRNFGNGRFVRQFFEAIKMKHAERVIANGLINEELIKIYPEDICII